MDLTTSTEVANLETNNLTGEAPVTGDTQANATPVTPSEMYEVKVNGQTIKVPLDELRNGYSRQQDYTKKTMDLANERNTWTQRETQYQTELRQHQDQLNRISQFLNEPRVQSALRQLQAGIEDPNKPLTAEQVLQLQRQEAARQQEMFSGEFQRIQQELEVRHLANQYAGEIDSTIKQLQDKHPVLQDIDGLGQLLKQHVAQRNPQDISEAKQYFVEIAEAMANKLTSRFQTQQKQAAVDQAKLVKNGIETGGQTPAIVPPEKKFKLGSNDLFQAAVSDLMHSALNK
jgi:hypothetical protein